MKQPPPPPPPLLAGTIAVGVTFSRSNTAVTEVATLAVTEQVVPLWPKQAPFQPVKTDPDAGTAVRVTTVSEEKSYAQVLPQSMPAGEELTVPVPVPPLLTVKVYSGMPGAPDPR